MKKINCELGVTLTYKGTNMGGLHVYILEIKNQTKTVVTDRFELGKKGIFQSLSKDTLRLLGYEENLTYQDYLEIIDKYLEHINLRLSRHSTEYNFNGYLCYELLGYYLFTDNNQEPSGYFSIDTVSKEVKISLDKNLCQLLFGKDYGAYMDYTEMIQKYEVKYE